LVIGHFFNSLCSNELIISFNNYLGCLDIFFIISFLVCDFQGTFFLTVLSVIRNQNLFSSLITGKSSYVKQHCPAGRVDMTLFSTNQYYYFSFIFVFMSVSI